MDVLHRWWRHGVAAIGLLALAVGAVWWIVQGQPPPAASREAPPADPPASARQDPSTVVEGTNLPPAEEARRLPGDPMSIRIPDLDVDASVIPVLAPGGVLTPPEDPQEIGWWADGARPGESRGSALVTGHTVSTGGGALDDLEELDDGDAISVLDRQGRTDYSVQSVEILGKGDLAKQAELLFSQAVPGRLVVVTCEDWNGEEYLSNVVVTATPAATR